jgi:hypothetical protein
LDGTEGARSTQPILVVRSETVPPSFVTVTEAARRRKCHRVTMWRQMRRHPGLAINLCGRWLIPAQHVELLAMGVPAAEIAAKAVRHGIAA